MRPGPASARTAAPPRRPGTSMPPPKHAAIRRGPTRRGNDPPGPAQGGRRSGPIRRCRPPPPAASGCSTPPGREPWPLPGSISTLHFQTRPTVRPRDRSAWVGGPNRTPGRRELAVSIRTLPTFRGGFTDFPRWVYRLSAVGFTDFPRWVWAPTTDFPRWVYRLSAVGSRSQVARSLDLRLPYSEELIERRTDTNRPGWGWWCF